VNATAVKLLRLTGPIALSEVLWGMSTFIYAVVFTRLGTMTLTASQIVLSLESIFIVASRFDLRKNDIWSVFAPPSPTLEKRSSGTATGAQVFSVYCASKAATCNFARSCIVELKEQRNHINVISPGPPPRPQPICISKRPKRGLRIIMFRRG
jgi:hypothetical protein